MKKPLGIILGFFISALVIAPISAAQELVDPVLDPLFIEYYYPYNEMVVIDPVLDPAALVDPVILYDPVIDPALDPASNPDLTDPALDPSLNPEFNSNTTQPTDTTGTLIPPEELTPPPTEPPPEYNDPTGTFVPEPIPEPTPERDPIPGRDPLPPREPIEPDPTPEKPEPEIIVIQPKYPHPNQVINRVIPQVTKNQLNFILIILIGVTAGIIVWILTGYIINSAQANRDTKRSKRQTAYSIQNLKSKELEQSYGKINDALSAISETLNTKSNPTKTEIADFNKASVEIKLFGSDETVKAQKNFANLISQTKAPSQKDYNTAKNELLQSLKKDLGLG